MLKEARVPCGPINDMRAVFEDPQIVYREMVQHIQHPSAGRIPLVSPPLLLDGKQCKVL